MVSTQDGKRNIIRYDVCANVVAKERGDIPEFRGFVIETSLNPYLTSYFYYSWETEPRNIILLNLEELFVCAKRVLFFTYLTKTNIELGKIRVIKYVHPACSLEAEVRFIFDRKKQFNGKLASLREAEKAIEWTRLLQFLRELMEIGKRVMDLRTHLGWMNTLDYLPEHAKYLTKNQMVFIKKVKEYDQHVIQVSSMVASTYR